MSNLQDLAAEAYIFAVPLVYNLDQMKKSVEEGFGVLPAVPYNQFSYGQKLTDASDKFVTTNNDTVYNNAQLDLSAGPVLFEIPDMGDRYSVFQFVDAWTNNFAYIGQRSIGGNGGKFVITSADYEGELPEGYTQITTPTRFMEIVGRIAVTDEADLQNVKALQANLHLYQMNKEAKPAGIPTATGDNDMIFWNKFKAYFNESHYAERYQPLIDKYSTLGIFDGNISDDAKQALLAAPKTGQQQIKHLLENVPFPVENGWQKDFHVFDYNFDYFELGSLDTDEWKLPHSNEKELVQANFIRAAAALGGLWGNQGFEAVYLPIYVDSDNNQLNGSHDYEVHFEQTPPTNAFWSVTMYNTTGFTLVENPIDRYSIGDRTKGIKYDEDGGLTIRISHKEPQDDANWLPSPDADFRPVLRVYLPTEDVINGTYHFPAIKKI